MSQTTVSAGERPPALSVVIPTFQRCSLLRRQLAEFTRQTLPGDRFEIIITVDGSTDGTPTMLRHVSVPYPLVWLNGPRRGPGPARNAGAARARGRILLFLDDDVIPSPQLLAEHLAVHDRQEDQVCLGGLASWPGRVLSPWERYLNERFVKHYAKLSRSGHELDFWDCLSGNMSLPRTLFAHSGGFDPDFGRDRHEDIELGYRLAGLGVTFRFHPAALGYHQLVKSVDEGLRDAVANGRSAIRLSRFHPALRPAPAAATWQHYPPTGRRLFRFLLHHPARTIHAAAGARALLRRLASGHLAYAARLPIFRFAYHLHFWHGVQIEATPAELAELIHGQRSGSAAAAGGHR